MGRIKRHVNYIICEERGPKAANVIPTALKRRFNGALVKVKALIKTNRTYSVRGHIDMGPPITVHPYEIREMGTGRRPRLCWTTMPGACLIISPIPLRDEISAKGFLLRWARDFVASIEYTASMKKLMA
jgi:hypothetical protein